MNMKKKKNKPIDFWKSKPIKKKGIRNTFGTKLDMNWKQAKRAYPKLKPYGDWDKDGVKNKKDCKPFDKNRHVWVKGLGWRATNPERKQAYNKLISVGYTADEARQMRQFRPSKVAQAIKEGPRLNRLQKYAEVGTNVKNPDFYIQRRGSEETVGRVRKKGEQVKGDIGVKSKGKMLPLIAKYNMDYVQGTGYYRPRAIGTLRLKNIRVEDVKKAPVGQGVVREIERENYKEYPEVEGIFEEEEILEEEYEE